MMEWLIFPAIVVPYVVWIITLAFSGPDDYPYE